ncbi:MAG: hypothetical protein ACJA2W_002591, partial [Planctomycetota bacterium]
MISLVAADQAAASVQTDEPEGASSAVDAGQDTGTQDAGTQANSAEAPEEPITYNHTHLPIGFNDSGLCIGNSKRWNGVRLNFADRGVEEITGLNVGIWDFEGSSVDQMNGIDIGLKNQVGEGQGVSLGLFGTAAHESLSGVGLGGLAVFAKKELRGIHLGGL